MSMSNAVKALYARLISPKIRTEVDLARIFLIGAANVLSLLMVIF